MSLKAFKTSLNEVVRNSPKVLGLNFVIAVYALMTFCLISLFIVLISFSLLGAIIFLVVLSLLGVMAILIFGDKLDDEEDY